MAEPLAPEARQAARGGSCIRERKVGTCDLTSRSRAMRLSLAFAAFALVVLSAYVPSAPASSAPPEARADTTQWQNLQVLPDTLTRDELIGIMRGFADGLGVQCGFCHVREDGEFAFASDDKPHKETARGMIRMVRQINVEILPAIEGAGEHEHGEAHEHGEGHGHEAMHGEMHGREMPVTCWTCHRGETTPSATPPPREPRR